MDHQKPIDPTVPIFNAVLGFIQQKLPHVRNPTSIMTVISYNSSGSNIGTTSAQHVGDIQPNGVKMPHLIPYGAPIYTYANSAVTITGYTVPQPNDIIIVENTPQGPFIKGKLSA